MPASMSATLARALEAQGIESHLDTSVFPNLRWFRNLCSADVIIIVVYRRFGPRNMLKFLIALIMCRPLIRWWVGTDVLNCLEDTGERRFARLLDRFVTTNLAVAPHLKSELALVGIDASVAPSVLDRDKHGWDMAAGPPPRRILTYLPTSRGTFYGEEFVRKAIASNPDVEFLIVGCEDRDRFAEYPNARNLGWVHDIAPVYPEVGCLLRITNHDGLPRMVLESLLQGKYVIYSQHLPGCWFATDFDQIQAHVRRFLAIDAPNVEGHDAVRRLLDPDPTERFALAIQQAILKDPLRRRLRRNTAAPVLASFYFWNCLQGWSKRVFATRDTRELAATTTPRGPRRWDR